MKDINKDIEKLLTIKEEIERINKIKAEIENTEIVSQRMYNFLQDNNLLKQDVNYVIASLDIKPYIEDYRG